MEGIGFPIESLPFFVIQNKFFEISALMFFLDADILWLLGKQNMTRNQHQHPEERDLRDRNSG